MKSYLLAGAATLAAVASASSSAPECPPAAVYMFNGEQYQQQQQQQGKSDAQVASLDLDQTQLVLADFVGTSHLYPAKSFKSGFNFGSISQMFAGKGANDAPPAAVVVVNGLPAQQGHNLFEDSPAFEIEEAPSPSFWRALVDKIVHDVSEVTGGEVKASMDKAVTVVSDWASNAAEELDGFFKKEKRNMDDTEHNAASQRVIDDVNNILGLSSTLQRGQTAVLRIESLSMVLGSMPHEYERALESVKVALQTVLEQSYDLRMLVVASPSDACTNKARTLLKRSASVGGLHKRASGLEDPAGPFSSKETCETTTDSCSGHGSCVKLASGQYACACESTYDSDKKKTTRWGGNACQKKDVSVETQMFLWSGLGIVFTIFAGIKLLFSVGSEPLPGILNVAKRSSS